MSAYLVSIDTQTGMQVQIWHGDRGGFVGCGHLSPVTKIALPDREAPWTIAAAIEFAIANPDVSKDAR